MCLVFSKVLAKAKVQGSHMSVVQNGRWNLSTIYHQDAFG